MYGMIGQTKTNKIACYLIDAANFSAQLLSHPVLQTHFLAWP